MSVSDEGVLRVLVRFLERGATMSRVMAAINWGGCGQNLRWLFPQFDAQQSY